MIGVPDDEMGEEVGAAVVLKEGEDVAADELSAYVKERGRRLQVPAQDLVRRRAAQGPDRQDPQARDRGAGGGQDLLMADRSASLDTLLADAGGGATRALVPGRGGGEARGPPRHAAVEGRAPRARATGPSSPRSRSASPTSRRRRRTAASRTTPGGGIRRSAGSPRSTWRPGTTVDDLISDAGLDERSERRVRFSAENVLDALAPTNFPALNPAALKATLDTGGRNLVQGSANLVHDLAQAAAHPGDGRHEGVHGRRGPRGHARRGRAAAPSCSSSSSTSRARRRCARRRCCSSRR